MSKKVAVLLAKGFEEAEAIMTIDVLRRLNISVTTLACQDMLEITSYHNIRMFADALLERNMDETFDAVVIPGGPEGTVNLAANPLVVEFIRRHDEAGNGFAPSVLPLPAYWAVIICSRGAVILAQASFIRM